MEEIKVGGPGLQAFLMQNNAAKRLLHQNYVNQYKSYYDGCLNLNKWTAYVTSRLNKVNQFWDKQHSSFGEFRENSRKVTFNESVQIHDYIDSDLELVLDSGTEDDERNSGGDNGGGNFGKDGFVVNSNYPQEFQNQSAIQTVENGMNSLVMRTPQTSELPEDLVSPFLPVQDEIRTSKSESTPNLVSQAESDLDDIGLDVVKTTLSDTMIVSVNNKPAKRSPKNRVGTPRFLNKSSDSDRNTTNLSQLLDMVGTEGKGDEETEVENIDMKKKKEEETSLQCIPIHPSVTKIKLTTALVADPQNQSISPDQLPLEVLAMPQDSASHLVSVESGATSSTHQLIHHVDGDQISLPISAISEKKEPRKVKRTLKSQSDLNNNKSPKQVKASVSKPVTKEKPVTMYVRRENARLQGQRLFNEIKQQISKHDMDKKILSTIFNKQFVALLLREETVRKYRENFNTSVSIFPIIPTKVVAFGSKWASKPGGSKQIVAVPKTPTLASPKKIGDNKLNNEAMSPKLQREKVANKKPKPDLNKRDNTEKVKPTADSSASSTTALKQKSPKKEKREKSEKRSKSKIPKKTVEITETRKDKEVSTEKVTVPNGDIMEGLKISEAKSTGKERTCTIIPTKIPQPISKSVKDKGAKLSVLVPEKHFTLNCDNVLKNRPNSITNRTEKPLTAPPTNPLDHSSFDRWYMESKKFESRKKYTVEDRNSMKLSAGDERELKILRSIKRNPQMLDAYTTYRFGGPLSPTELELILKRS